MSQARYYSPAIRRDLVSKLYWEAQSRKIPMTKLIDQIVSEKLGRYHAKRRQDDRAETGYEQLLLDLK
jgi:hypothetical protein